MITHEDIAGNLRAYRALTEEWRDHVTQVRIDLFGTVPDAIFEDKVRQFAIASKRELWAKLSEVAADLDVQRVALEVRMVEAHEWLQGLREGAEQS